jgi:hypothetical protein
MLDALREISGWVKKNFWSKADNIILRSGQYLRVGNSQLKGDKLGIGTLSPGDQLHIYAAGGEAIMKAESGGAYNASVSLKNGLRTWLVMAHSSGKFSVRDNTAGVNRFWIDATGRTGISKDAPEESLHVAGQILSSGGLGWTCIKENVANATLTAIARATYSNGTAGSFLVTVSAYATGCIGSAAFVVSTAWETESVFSLGAALHGFTALSLTAYMNTTTHVLTLSVEHANPSALAATIRMAIQPTLAGVGASNEVTFSAA